MPHSNLRPTLPDDSDDPAPAKNVASLHSGSAAVDVADDELRLGAGRRREELLKFIAGIIARSIPSGGGRHKKARSHAEEQLRSPCQTPVRPLRQDVFRPAKSPQPGAAIRHD